MAAAFIVPQTAPERRWIMQSRSCRSGMCLTFCKTLNYAAVLMLLAAIPSASNAEGHIDANTVIVIPHGSFQGVQYMRYEAMFEGVTPNNRPYRVPCQIIAPQNPNQGRGLLLFDW